MRHTEIEEVIKTYQEAFRLALGEERDDGNTDGDLPSGDGRWVKGGALLLCNP
jgi:hypothetical protein